MPENGGRIKTLRVGSLTLREFVDELYRQHPVDGFKVRAGTIYIFRNPPSQEPLPLEFAFGV